MPRLFTISIHRKKELPSAKNHRKVEFWSSNIPCKTNSAEMCHALTSLALARTKYDDDFT